MAETNSWGKQFADLGSVLDIAHQWGNRLINPSGAVVQEGSKALGNAIQQFTAPKGVKYYAGAFEQTPQGYRVRLTGKDASGRPYEGPSMPAEAFAELAKNNPEAFKHFDKGKMYEYMGYGSQNIADQKLQRVKEEAGIVTPEERSTRYTVDSDRNTRLGVANISAGVQKDTNDSQERIASGTNASNEEINRHRDNTELTITDRREEGQNTRQTSAQIHESGERALDRAQRNTEFRGYLQLSAQQLADQRAESENDRRMLFFAMIQKGLNQMLGG